MLPREYWAPGPGRTHSRTRGGGGDGPSRSRSGCDVDVDIDADGGADAEEQGSTGVSVLHPLLCLPKADLLRYMQLGSARSLFSPSAANPPSVLDSNSDPDSNSDSHSEPSPSQTRTLIPPGPGPGLKTGDESGALWYTWCEDESNTDTAYRRNELRLDLVPLLDRLCGGPHVLRR